MYHKRLIALPGTLSLPKVLLLIVFRKRCQFYFQKLAQIAYGGVAFIETEQAHVAKAAVRLPNSASSHNRKGCLVEGAFYALLFWEGLIDPPPAPIRRRQTLFPVLLNASRGLQLQCIADPAAQAVLREPIAYGATQLLGEWMRDQGIEAFEYLSARSSDALVQVGVLTSAVFQSTPFDQVEITTELTADHASFLCHDNGQLHHFPLQQFLISGQLPWAAH